MRWRWRSTFPATKSAWSHPTSAAVSAARARSTRRRFSFAPRRGGSARAVKWTSDRMEDLTASSQGFDEIVDAELALDSEGRMLALRADVIGDVGAYSIYPWTAALEPVQVVSFLPGPYRIANYRGRVRAVATSKAPTGPYRGVGRPISTFVMERLMDMAAAKTRDRRQGDPAAKSYRRRRVSLQSRVRHRLGQIGLSGMSGTPLAPLSVTMICARNRRSARGRPLVRHRHRLLCGADRHRLAHLRRARHADQYRHRDGDRPHRSSGAVTAAFGVASHGQGLETTLAQIVAEHLGARFEDMRIVQGDSAAVPGGTGTYASRSLVLAGGAATLAAQAVREKMLNAASHLLEASAADLVAEDGKIYVAGTDRSVTFREVARAVYSEAGGCRRRRARSWPPPRPTIRCSAPRPRRHTSPRSRSIRRLSRCASNNSPSPRIAAGWSIR